MNYPDNVWPADPLAPWNQDYDGPVAECCCCGEELYRGQKAYKAGEVYPGSENWVICEPCLLAMHPEVIL